MWEAATEGKSRHLPESAHMNKHKTGGKPDLFPICTRDFNAGLPKPFNMFLNVFQERNLASWIISSRLISWTIVMLHFNSQKFCQVTALGISLFRKDWWLHFGKLSRWLWSTTPKQQWIKSSSAWHHPPDVACLDTWMWTRCLQENKRITMLHEYGFKNSINSSFLLEMHRITPSCF